MNRLLFALIASLPLGFAANAQYIDGNPYQSSHVGVRVSADISQPADAKMGDVKVNMYDSRAGVSAGVYYCVPFASRFFFEPAAYLFYDTYGISNLVYGADLTDYVSGYKDKLGVRVPLDFGVHFDVSDNATVFIKTGPQFSYGLVSKVHCDVDDFDGNNMYDDGGLKRFDMEWGFGAGVAFGRFNVSLKYELGLLNQFKNSSNGVSYKENYFRIGVGYII